MQKRRETTRTAVVVERGVFEAGIAEPPMAPDLACAGRSSRWHGNPEWRDPLLLDEPMVLRSASRVAAPSLAPITVYRRSAARCAMVSSPPW